jgi:hypothetical protein
MRCCLLGTAISPRACPHVPARHILHNVTMSILQPTWTSHTASIRHQSTLQKNSTCGLCRSNTLPKLHLPAQNTLQVCDVIMSISQPTWSSHTASIRPQ